MKLLKKLKRSKSLSKIFLPLFATQIETLNFFNNFDYRLITGADDQALPLYLPISFGQPMYHADLNTKMLHNCLLNKLM